MVTHPPSPSKTLLRRRTSNASLPRMAEHTMVPRRQRARTPLIPGDEPLLPLTPNVPSTQTSLEHPDSDCGRRGSDSSSAPNTGNPSHGITGALQRPDRNTPHHQLQRNTPRDTPLQAQHLTDSSVQNVLINQDFTRRKPTSTAHSKRTPPPRIARVGSSGISSRWLPVTARF